VEVSYAYERKVGREGEGQSLFFNISRTSWYRSEGDRVNKRKKGEIKEVGRTERKSE